MNEPNANDLMTTAQVDRQLKTDGLMIGTREYATALADRYAPVAERSGDILWTSSPDTYDWDLVS